MSSSTLGVAIDQLFKQHEKIRKLEVQVNKEKKTYNDMEVKILQRFDKSDLEKGTGKLATASLGGTDHANIKDYNQLVTFVHKYKAYDLFQRRLSITALRARMEEKVRVPGVEIFRNVKINLTKRSK